MDYPSISYSAIVDAASSPIGMDHPGRRGRGRGQWEPRSFRGYLHSHHRFRHRIELHCQLDLHYLLELRRRRQLVERLLGRHFWRQLRRR